MEQTRKIPVPNALIDNKSISPRTTYLYVILREISSFKTGEVTISIRKLKQKLNWSSSRTLKKHCEILRAEGFIYYDYEAFPKFKPLEFACTIQKDNFEFIDSDTLDRLQNIKGIEVEKIVRLYLLYKQYKNTVYNYCWLSYKEISQKVSMSYSTIKKINDLLTTHKILEIIIGGGYIDDEGLYKKERNQYFISC